MPEPDAGTVCVEPVDELSVIVSVPDAVPVTVGAKVTWIVQEAPAPNNAGQLFVWENVAPLITMLDTLSGAEPIFWRIIGMAGV